MSDSDEGGSEKDKRADARANGMEANQQVPSGDDQSITDEKQDRKLDVLENRIKRGELWIIFLTAAMTFAAFAAVYVARKQWRVMEQQTKVMQDTLADARKSNIESGKVTDRQLGIAEKQASSQGILADANKDIAAAATKSAKATEQLARATTDAAAASRSLAESAGKSSAATQRLADATAMQLEHVDRPFIAVSVLGEAVTSGYASKGMAFSFRISLANEGHSAARTTRVNFKIAFNSPRATDTQLVSEEIDAACTTATDLKRTFGVIDGGMIRPTESFTAPVGITLPDDRILPYIVGDTREPGGRGLLVEPMLIGCVAYRIPYSTRMHHTPFAFNFQPKKPKWPEWFLFKMGATVNDIVMVQNENVLAQHQPD